MACVFDKNEWMRVRHSLLQSQSFNGNQVSSSSKSQQNNLESLRMPHQKDNKPGDDIIQHEQVPENDSAVRSVKGDAEVDRYAQDTVNVHVDAATNKMLFWKVNKRILVVMLGVSVPQSPVGAV